ncbi:MAG: thiamine pyrophosphate-binding protein [Candidatus Abyssubacteria bacterium]
MNRATASLTSTSGARALISCLEAAEIKRIYGIIGTSNFEFVNALYDKQDSIRYITTRHEQVATSMADAEARLTGKPGVCLVHSGPGALNAMLGAATAYKDCSPLIIIAGAVRTALRGTDGMLELNQCRVFEPVCKAVFRVEDVAGLPSIFTQAYHIAMTPARGPVLIEVPDQLWVTEGEADLGSLNVTPPPPKRADIADVKDVFRLFRDSRRTLVLAGAGVADANAADHLRRFAENANILVATTGNGRGVLPETHPLCLGRAGFAGGNPVADAALEQADLVIALGCCLSDLTTYEFTTHIPGKVVVVNAAENALESLPKSYRVDLRSLQADVGDFLNKFLNLLDEEPVRKTGDWMDSLLPVKEEWESQLAAAAASDKTPLSPGRVLKTLSDLAPDDTIFVGGAGLNAVYVCDFIKIRTPRGYIAPNNFGTMGYGFGAALAAKLVNPDKPVLCVLGDGDFMMTVQDLETGVREGIVATIVILNDNCYRALRYSQNILHAGRIYGTEYNNPDFVKLAESFGTAGFLIETPDQIEPVLNKALSCGKLAIVDARIDVDDVVPTNMQAIFKMRGLE